MLNLSNLGKSAGLCFCCSTTSDACVVVFVFVVVDIHNGFQYLDILIKLFAFLALGQSKPPLFLLLRHQRCICIEAKTATRINIDQLQFGIFSIQAKYWSIDHVWHTLVKGKKCHQMTSKNHQKSSRFPIFFLFIHSQAWFCGLWDYWYIHMLPFLVCPICIIASVAIITWIWRCCQKIKWTNDKTRRG